MNCFGGILYVLLLLNKFILTNFIIYADKKTHYGVKVKGVEITPNPIARGQPATFSIAATTGIMQYYYDILLTCLFDHCFLVSCRYHIILCL